MGQFVLCRLLTHMRALGVLFLYCVCSWFPGEGNSNSPSLGQLLAHSTAQLVLNSSSLKKKKSRYIKFEGFGVLISGFCWGSRYCVGDLMPAFSYCIWVCTQVALDVWLSAFCGIKNTCILKNLCRGFYLRLFLLLPTGPFGA